MAKFSGPQEIYKELVEDSDQGWLQGLVAFAFIEEQRIEWMRHQEKHTGRLPSPDDIQKWYEEQPDGVLLRAKSDAEKALEDYSDSVIEVILDAKKRGIRDDAIVKEVREANAFWPQFVKNIASGLTSNLIFAALLACIAFFVLNDTSPAEIGNWIRQLYEETDNA